MVVDSSSLTPSEFSYDLSTKMTDSWNAEEDLNDVLNDKRFALENNLVTHYFSFEYLTNGRIQ